MEEEEGWVVQDGLLKGEREEKVVDRSSSASQARLRDAILSSHMTCKSTTPIAVNGNHPCRPTPADPWISEDGLLHWVKKLWQCNSHPWRGRTTCPLSTIQHGAWSIVGPGCPYTYPWG